MTNLMLTRTSFFDLECKYYHYGPDTIFILDISLNVFMNYHFTFTGQKMTQKGCSTPHPPPTVVSFVKNVQHNFFYKKYNFIMFYLLQVFKFYFWSNNNYQSRKFFSDQVLTYKSSLIYFDGLIEWTMSIDSLFSGQYDQCGPRRTTRLFVTTFSQFNFCLSSIAIQIQPPK